MASKVGLFLTTCWSFGIELSCSLIAMMIRCCWGCNTLFEQKLMCLDQFFFCNIPNSFLSLGRPQLYNLEALPFTYDQYVVIELADKLYNSVTVCFLCESMNLHPDKQLFQVAGTVDWTTDPWIIQPALYLYNMREPLMPVVWPARGLISLWP